MKAQIITICACVFLAASCSKSDTPPPCNSGISCTPQAPEDNLSNGKPHPQMRQYGDTLVRKSLGNDNPVKDHGLTF